MSKKKPYGQRPQPRPQPRQNQNNGQDGQGLAIAGAELVGKYVQLAGTSMSKDVTLASMVDALWYKKVGEASALLAAVMYGRHLEGAAERMRCTAALCQWCKQYMEEGGKGEVGRATPLHGFWVHDIGDGRQQTCDAYQIWEAVTVKNEPDDSAD